MKKKNIAIFLNGMLFVMVLIATIIMFIGFEFMGHGVPFTTTKLSVFKFFTVDSNLLLGISSLLLVIQEKTVLKKKKEVRDAFYILKFAATTSVFLTMAVTAFFLAPFSSYRFIDFYLNSNLFFHFLIPLFSIISFVFYDSCDFSFRYTFYGILPMILYAIGYVIYLLPHVQGNHISLKYDFYGFFRWGVSSVWYVVPVMLSVTYGLGFILWLWHHQCIKKKDNR